jgi:hypothetical protein
LAAWKVTRTRRGKMRRRVDYQNYGRTVWKKNQRRRRAEASSECTLGWKEDGTLAWEGADIPESEEGEILELMEDS